MVGQTLRFSSSAKLEIIRSTILNLPVRIRFTPKTYAWILGNQQSTSVIPNYKLKTAGDLVVSMGVSFGVEYEFPGLTNWTNVNPNILANATPLLIKVGDVTPPKQVKRTPRLVLSPCSPGRWGC